MGKKKKELPPLPDLLPIDLSPEPEVALLTALGGLPLVSQTFRTLGLHSSVERHVKVKQRQNGFSESEVVESLVLLHAAGGDCVDDLRRLREDDGLQAMPSYEWEIINWLRDERRPDGPRGAIGFAISADMSKELRAAIVALGDSAWTPYKAPGQPVDEERDWAEVAFVPSEPYERKDSEPLRYVAIRIRPRQGALFADGSEVKHFAVVTNRKDLDGARLLQWHREKAGTIEQVNDIVKNDLGGGVVPSKYFGVDAAWLRIALLAHNVLVALKRIALPPEYLEARPKRLRYQLFVQAGRLVSHARALTLRLRTAIDRLCDFLAAWRTLRAPAPA